MHKRHRTTQHSQTTSVGDVFKYPIRAQRTFSKSMHNDLQRASLCREGLQGVIINTIYRYVYMHKYMGVHLLWLYMDIHMYVAGVSQGCRMRVTGVSQGCHRGVKGVSQGCHRGSAGVSQGFKNGVTGVSQGCRKGVTGVSQGCHVGCRRDVAGMSQGCRRNVTGVSQECRRGVA